MRIWGCVAAFLALASASYGQVITDPDWAEKPSGEQVQQAYPKLAHALGLEGEALLHCEVTAGGVLENCSVLSATPGELGFAEAALSLTAYFRMRPQVRDGRPVASDVRIPIRFIMPETEPLPVQGPPASSKGFKLARQLVEIMGLADQVRRAYELKGQYLEAARTPGSTAEARKVAASALRGAAEGRIDEILDSYAAAYAHLYSEAELSDLVRAAKGPHPPAGLAANTKLSEAQQKLMVETTRRVYAAARAIFCEARPCTPDRDFGVPRAGQKGPKVTINAPIWLERPTYQQIEAARPPLATWFRMEGRVQLACTIAQLGIADTCEVVEESPAGVGFGAAAKTLKGYFRLSPAMLQRDGGDVAAVQVRFPPPFDRGSGLGLPATIPESRLAAARRFVQATTPQESRDAQVETTLRAFNAMRLEGVSPEARATAADALRKAVSKIWPDLQELAARTFAAELDEAELDSSTAFAQSSTGRAAERHRGELYAASQAIFLTFDSVISADAGRAFCKVRGCVGPAARRPPPASTRRS